MKQLSELITDFEKADRALHVALHEAACSGDVDTRDQIDEAYSLSSLGRIRALAAAELAKAPFPVRRPFTHK